MRKRQGSRLVALLHVLYRGMFRAFPLPFRAEFGDEMAAVLDERLAAAAQQGRWSLISLGVQELGQMPAALLRAHLYRWQKKRQMVRRVLTRTGAPPLFGVPPPAGDGRFSVRQLLLELAPFLLAASLILLLTYRSPSWLPAAWGDPLRTAAVWAGLLPWLPFLLGLARGMPRWAYPYAGLLLGYTLLAAAQQRLIWLWALLLLMAIGLAIIAMAVQRANGPLPTFVVRLGASAALDWTRLSFGAFGAAPVLVLAAFDNSYLNHRTPYLALSLLLMVATVVVYSRRRRQDRQLAALLGGTTLLLVPALLENVTWRGTAAGSDWLAALWAAMVTWLLLPLLSVPLHWIPVNLLPGHNSEE
jgi:hypothetical protein